QVLSVKKSYSLYVASQKEAGKIKTFAVVLDSICKLSSLFLYQGDDQERWLKDTFNCYETEDIEYLNYFCFNNITNYLEKADTLIIHKKVLQSLQDERFKVLRLDVKIENEWETKYYYFINHAGKYVLRNIEDHLD
ncbi:MAG: hypothetical protein JXI43_09240, partial [Tissierellales bacterium]|nr:hypothetical protein [Tissierellales bacterium]